MKKNSYFLFSVKKNGPKTHTTVTIRQSFVKKIYDHILQVQKEKTQTLGFAQRQVPLSYIETTCKNNIIDYLKEFLFKHSVVNTLYRSLIEKKVVAPRMPELEEIILEPLSDAQFVFSHTEPPIEQKHEWKRIAFKKPQRKNYKDLDRQVRQFIESETEKHIKAGTSQSVGQEDWICFSIKLLNTNEKTLVPNHTERFWLRMGTEESDREMHYLFGQRNAGESFITDSLFLQNYFSAKLNSHYLFNITIEQCIPAAYFSLAGFKKYFSLSSEKDMHRKLIEVFSTRNDITQRREIIEATFKKLASLYPVDVPENLVLDEINDVLEELRFNPDYHVYKAQRDFEKKVRMLAEKQLVERTIIDYIAYQENIHVTPDDIATYLNLLQRSRIKDFIYFALPRTQIGNQELPIAQEVIHQACLREKTLNHIIHYLTK